jgi:cytochrome oxidase assembly protein ShyY1
VAADHVLERPAERPASAVTRLKQVLIVLLGLIIGTVMVVLGLWQLGVYNAQGHQRAADRAAAPPVDLVKVARPGQEVGDAYGRTVRATGEYDPTLQVLLPIRDRPGHYRVLTGLRLESGGAVAVARGVSQGDRVPAPPSGVVTQSGIFLPSESAGDPAEPGAEPTAVSLPSLAQRWEPQLISGFVTLDAAGARAQSLEPVPVELPSGQGRLRNGFYALQWWVFAAFAVAMSIRMARDFGREAAVASLEADERSTPHDVGSEPGAESRESTT